MESAEQAVVTEAPKTLEFSLRGYASTEIPNFNQALQTLGVNPSASIVFGSAVHPSETSRSTQINPTGWDIDVLTIVDSIASLREKPDSIITTASGRRYGCIVAPSGGVTEIQEIGSMGVKSPKRGLQVTLMEESELLDGELEPVVRRAFETGVIMEGQISESVRKVLERSAVPMPKKADEVAWSVLKYTAARRTGNQGDRII